MDQPIALSVPEVARMLGICRSAAYQAVKSGELPSVRVGKRIIVPTERLLAMLDGRREASEP